MAALRKNKRNLKKVKRFNSSIRLQVCTEKAALLYEDGGETEEAN
jgi:hypothetical protein